MIKTFGLFRRLADGISFAIWLEDGSPVRALAIDGPADPEKRPSTYDAAQASPITGWDLSSFEQVGGIWRWSRLVPYRIGIEEARRLAPHWFNKPAAAAAEVKDNG